MNVMRDIRAVATINNAISAELTKQDLAARGISLNSVALILLRDIRESWMEQCAVVLRYPGRPARGFVGQRHFLGFYRAGARLLRDIEQCVNLDALYLVNNDNLISAHLLYFAERNPSVCVSVVAEGLMNFQEIGTANRQGWRWRVKPIAARVLGFRYREPTGHLSGAFDPRVARVVSFAKDGLKAPPDKVVLRRFEAIQPVRQSDPNVVLVVLTGLNQWMNSESYERFACAFVAWLKNSGFRKIQVKKHPRVSAGLMEVLLDGYEEVGIGQTTEALGSDLEAGTIVGTCCTALVTLKLIRPDLKCIDFGSDYYIEHAYHGDDSVKTLLSATGVTLVQMPATAGVRQRIEKA